MEIKLDKTKTKLLKKCTACLKFKLISSDFYLVKKANGRVAPFSQCKECRNLKSRERRKNPRVKARMLAYWRANKKLKQKHNYCYAVKTRLGGVKMNFGAASKNYVLNGPTGRIPGDKKRRKNATT